MPPVDRRLLPIDTSGKHCPANFDDQVDHVVVDDDDEEEEACFQDSQNWTKTKKC